MCIRDSAEGMHRLETARPGDAAEVCTSGRLLSGDLVDTIVEHDHHEVRHVRRDDRSERAEVHEQRTISTAHDHALAWLRERQTEADLILVPSAMGHGTS